MTRLRHRLRRTVLTALALACVAGPAAAEVDSSACLALYVQRNAVFHKKGLCFTRDAALVNFPNNPRTCIYATADEMPPLTAREEAYIRSIRHKERMLDCERR